MEDSLSHHGIKGQRWGVRRFQNKDGTLTSEGKRRAGQNVKDMPDDELSSQVKRLNLEKQYKKLSKEDAGPTKLESAKRAVDSASGMLNQAKNMSRSTTKKVRPDLSKMSDKDLRDLITRENLERQYTDLFGKEAASVSRGKKIVDGILEYGGGVLAVGSSALGIAMAIKELRK